MRRLAISVFLVLFALQSAALAHGKPAAAPRWGIVLAAFGSTKPQGMAGVEKVKARMEAAFPGVPVKVGLTSRHAVTTLRAPGLLTAMAQLADEGCSNVFVQPLHVSAGSEYQDMAALAAALNSLNKAGIEKPPFSKVVLGETALGRTRAGDPKAMAATAKALSADAALARGQDAALVYGAHGNPRWPAAEIKAFQAAMAKAYPGLTVLAATMESSPGVEDVLAGLKKSGRKKVIIYPLLFGAGVHAEEDLCGPEPESWKTLFEKAGYRVDCRMRGLGESDAFTDMIVERAKAAMAKAR